MGTGSPPQDPVQPSPTGGTPLATVAGCRFWADHLEAEGRYLRYADVTTITSQWDTSSVSYGAIRKNFGFSGMVTIASTETSVALGFKDELGDRHAGRKAFDETCRALVQYAGPAYIARRAREIQTGSPYTLEYGIGRNYLKFEADGIRWRTGLVRPERFIPGSEVISVTLKKVSGTAMPMFQPVIIVTGQQAKSPKLLPPDDFFWTLCLPDLAVQLFSTKS